MNTYYWIIGCAVIVIVLGLFSLWSHDRMQRRSRMAAYLVKMGFAQVDAEWIADASPDEQAKGGLVYSNGLIRIFHDDHNAILDAGVFRFHVNSSFGFHATLYQLGQHQLPLPRVGSRKEFYAVMECARRVLSCRRRDEGWPQERPTR